MQGLNRFAFKEWAVVCQAINSGRQSLILRKGGIHEGRDGFRVNHHEFWLFPTEFHQQPEVLTAAARPLLTEVQLRKPAPGTIAIQNYVVVEEVLELRDQSLLPRLAGLHAWSESTLEARFRYRNPMLFALLIRAYRLPEPQVLPETPHYAGCRSWVDLSQELPTDHLIPVLPIDDHRAHMNEIRCALTGEG